jgi:MFS transporter, DHA1 family, multidrug resistance protein
MGLLNKWSSVRFGMGTWLILFIQFLAFFTFFLFVPFISTYFSHTMGFSVSFVGMILAVRIISQQGLMMAGGFLADRFGYKPIAVLGFIVRGLGFAWLGLTADPILIIIAASLSGLGGAMFSPALKALVTFFTPSDRQKEAFSFMNIVENAGTVLGPLAGLYFKEDQFVGLCLISGALFGLMGLIVLFLPNPPSPKKSRSWIQESRQIFRHQSFMFIVISLMPFHFIYQQLYLTLPIAANQATGSSGWIFSFVTVLVIVFQWPISRFTDNKSLKRIFSLSYLFLGISFLFLAIKADLWTVLLALAGISVGSMMLLPSFQSYVANIAPKESLAAYFGFSNMAMAIGGSLGNLLGGMLNDYFADLNQPQYFWLTLSLLTVFPIIGALRLKYIQQKRRTSQLLAKIHGYRSDLY